MYYKKVLAAIVLSYDNIYKIKQKWKLGTGIYFLSKPAEQHFFSCNSCCWHSFHKPRVLLALINLVLKYYAIVILYHSLY